jgi:YGGT family
MWGILSIVFGLVEITIGARFIFQLIGANPASGFVTWIYNVSEPLVLPFTTVFGEANKPVAGTLPHSVFEPATLIALVVYGLIGGILLRVTASSRR